MVLSNQAIKSKLEGQDLFIGEDSKKSYPIDMLKFDTTSIDLHLGNEFKVWKSLAPGEQSSFDPSVEDFDLEEVAKTYVEDGHREEDGSFILRPNKFVLATTKEYIRLPCDLAARIEGRSKLGRLGIGVHITAPTIHALFEGNIALEIYNHSPRAVKLLPWKSLDKAGLRIAQLVFEVVDGNVETNQGATFLKQKTALGGKG